ncbi:sensor histidine kinase [Solimonas sp. K1W22B-7]|uniref:sensor histidine kinase n=1 Tax=Solimonas sp. K1W22B-7 TaxID=2303331 RepID=UPI0013C52C47|nr:HAMP domain-containing sensor histidine kinase [Solimonas sp. K1W22B-7]
MLRQRIRRIVLGLSVAAALLGGAALYVADEAIEDAAINDMLARQMDTLLEAEVVPEPQEQQVSTLKFFRPALGGVLPEALGSLQPGITEPVEIHGEDYCVYMREVAPGDAAYLAYPVEFVEQRERWLWLGVSLTALLVFSITWIAADRTTDRALRPYLELLEQVRALDPNRRHLRISVSHADSELNLVVSALNGRLEDIERLIERERAFAAAASHELRGPLMVISAAGEMMRDKIDPASQRSLQRLERGARDMREILDALLALSRTRVSSTLLEIHLEELLPEAVEPHLDEDGAARIDWRLTPEVLVASPGAVRVVFTNLFRNALQASPAGRVTVTLEHGCVTVDDQGPGVAPAAMPHLFEPGFHAREGGSGMGLYIARVLADRYGWELRVENREGGGARATWRFRNASRT